jgi:hypothetical protein
MKSVQSVKNHCIHKPLARVYSAIELLLFVLWYVVWRCYGGNRFSLTAPISLTGELAGGLEPITD